jgi:hypothetical protein
MRTVSLSLLLWACTTQPEHGSKGGAGGVCGPDADYGLALGQCALDFSLPDSLGTPFTLHAQRGSVALVDISAVW